jgi:tetratricopeptide (TPR) repeat protein
MQDTKGASLRGLVQAAQDAMRAGRMEEAMRSWEDVRAIAPAHPQALFHLGRYALFRKNPARARDLFEQAATADPDSPVLPLNLSYAFRDLGDGQREMDAIVRALTIDPYFFPALLAKGMLLERSGQLRKASQTYKNAIATSCAKMRWRWSKFSIRASRGFNIAMRMRTSPASRNAGTSRSARKKRSRRSRACCCFHAFRPCNFTTTPCFPG